MSRRQQYESGCKSKRRFTSAEQARMATRKAGFRIKIYACPFCHGLHVANGDKRSY